MLEQYCHIKVKVLPHEDKTEEIWNEVILPDTSEEVCRLIGMGILFNKGYCPGTPCEITVHKSYVKVLFKE